jgi:hypothetical protein
MNSKKDVFPWDKKGTNKLNNKISIKLIIETDPTLLNHAITDSNEITNDEYNYIKNIIENSEVTKASFKFWAKRGVDTNSFGFPLRCSKPRSKYYRKKRYDQNLWLNNGTWYICYTDPKTKKRIRKSLKTKDKKTAKRLRDLILLPIGYYTNDGRMVRKRMT